MTAAQDALVAALAAQDAAVYLYGVVDAYAAATRKADVAQCLTDHRTERDALRTAVTAGGGQAPAAAPAYATPEPVRDPITAARLAARIEDDCAAAYRNVLDKAESEDQRRLAVAGLGFAAVRGARWRTALGESEVITAFPGAPA